ncbi:uncharacterized protein PV06_07929 [Exophiala oligosperma]|uniref:Uncharacterized protein n=1 Tax=Exophiala oligosperma TaxID=215243 RepID=A0A0D2BTG5_9EURO|nr:uncharacterized protein PV06_07929 [Exophiala oligosperma]KIW40752.1 hypothetical protein PV06_07929 [Exophiala oligosperma]
MVWIGSRPRWWSVYVCFSSLFARNHVTAKGTVRVHPLPTYGNKKSPSVYIRTYRNLKTTVLITTSVGASENQKGRSVVCHHTMVLVTAIPGRNIKNENIRDRNVRYCTRFRSNGMNKEPVCQEQSPSLRFRERKRKIKIHVYLPCESCGEFL